MNWKWTSPLGQEGKGPNAAHWSNEFNQIDIPVVSGLKKNDIGKEDLNYYCKERGTIATVHSIRIHILCCREILQKVRNTFAQLTGFLSVPPFHRKKATADLVTEQDRPVSGGELLVMTTTTTTVCSSSGDFRRRRRHDRERGRRVATVPEVKRLGQPFFHYLRTPCNQLGRIQYKLMPFAK